MALIEVLQKRDVLCPSCISLDIEDVCFGRRPNDEITDCTTCKVEVTLHLMIVLQAGSITQVQLKPTIDVLKVELIGHG